FTFTADAVIGSASSPLPFGSTVTIVDASPAAVSWASRGEKAGRITPPSKRAAKKRGAKKKGLRVIRNTSLTYICCCETEKREPAATRNAQPVSELLPRHHSIKKQQFFMERGF